VTIDALPPFGPLAGTRLVDLTVAFAGAFSTMLLADLGAEVIKVESLQHYSTPSRGPRRPVPGNEAVSMSPVRDYPGAEPGPDPWNRISWFNSHGRNKRVVTMDLTRERGRELFLRLIEQSDGLVENNPPGLLEKLALGPDVLLGRNPRCIVVRLPPLGLSGPDHRTTGFGWHFEDLAGLLRLQGYADGPEVGSIFMDAASGPAGANAFLMALLARRRTGAGAVVEVAQVENLVAHIGDLTMEAAMNGRVPARWGNRSPDFAPQGVYPCAGDDAWVALSVRDDAEWARLVDVLAAAATDHAAAEAVAALRRPELDEVAARRHAHDEIDAALARWTAGHAPMEVARALQQAGIPAGPVLDEADTLGDRHLAARGFFVVLDHPSAGTHPHPGTNFRMDDTPLRVWRAAPTLGQDNEYVYRRLLGVGEAEFRELERAGHIGSTYA
jgi:crotonobetainyl-CoA:carnitine CoA-transferase CaiB-like acyl-CoA transferase